MFAIQTKHKKNQDAYSLSNEQGRRHHRSWGGRHAPPPFFNCCVLHNTFLHVRGAALGYEDHNTPCETNVMGPIGRFTPF